MPDCEKYLGCGFPLHRFRLNLALKNKWIHAGTSQADKPMDHEVRLAMQLGILSINISNNSYLYINSCSM